MALARKAARADIELPRNYLSFSQFRQYLTCAACYERQYIDGERGFVTPPLVYGSAAHKGLQHAREMVMAGQPWQLSDALDAARDGFEAALAGLDRAGEMPLTPPEPKLPASYDSWGKVKDDAVRTLKYALPLIIEAEERCGIRAVEASIDFSGVFNFPFVAYADVALSDPSLQRDLTVTDAKTASSDSLPDEWAAWQLAIYGLPWHHAGEQVGLGVNQIIKTKTPGVHLWTEPGYSIEPTPDQYAWLERQVEFVAEQISAGRFPASPSPYGCNHPHPGPKFAVVLEAVA